MWGLYLLLVMPLTASWVIFSFREAASLWEALPYISGDALGIVTFVFLFFAKRWRYVAIGYAGLALIAANWMVRAL